MATQLTPKVTQLLNPKGQRQALENLGLSSSLARLATFLAPDPLVPTPVGTLRFLDLAMRRTAPLARARMAKVLSDLGDSVPDRVWGFLERHPRVVEVRSPALAKASRRSRSPAWTDPVPAAALTGARGRGCASPGTRQSGRARARTCECGDGPGRKIRRTGPWFGSKLPWSHQIVP